MKTYSLSLITIVFCFLAGSGQIFSADHLREIEVADVNGNTLISNKGAKHGIAENAVYAIHRIRETGEVHLGIAIVSHVLEDSCRLKYYPVSRIKVRKGDLLVINEAATESSMKMLNDEYWNNLQNDQLAERAAFSDGQTLKRAKVKMRSGETKDLKMITVRRDEEIMLPSKTGFPECIKLSDIESVYVPTRNYSLFGALIGAALGTAAVLIMDQDNTIDTTYYYTDAYNIQGHYMGRYHNMKIVSKKDRMKAKYKSGIIVGGFILGTILGQRIDGGWKKIFPREEKISFDISPFNGHDESLGISMQFRF